MIRQKYTLLGTLLLLLFLIVYPVSAEGPLISPGEKVSVGDSGLDISQAVGTSASIAWWNPGADITNSPPSKVILIGNNVTNFSVNAADFVEYPGNWYQYTASTPDRAGPVAFVVYGYCGTEICPKPTIVSSGIGKEEAREQLENRPPEDETTWISDNIAEFLIAWNEKLDWGFSHQQINNKVLAMNESVLSKYRKPESPGYLTVPNRTLFYLEIGEALGLNRTQSEVFVQSVENNFAQSRMRNFESSGRNYDIPGPNETMIASGTGSPAPGEANISRTQTRPAPIPFSVPLLSIGIVAAIGLYRRS